MANRYFHGTTDVNIASLRSSVDPRKGKAFQDFSMKNNGFYITKDLAQAIDRANTAFDNFGDRPVVFIYSVEDAAVDVLTTIKYLDAHTTIAVPDGAPNKASDLIDSCRTKQDLAEDSVTEGHTHWIEGPIRLSRSPRVPPPGGTFFGHQVCVKIADKLDNSSAAKDLLNRSFVAFTLHDC
jgi:hypothetical protein